MDARNKGSCVGRMNRFIFHFVIKKGTDFVMIRYRDGLGVVALVREENDGCGSRLSCYRVEFVTDQESWTKWKSLSFLIISLFWDDWGCTVGLVHLGAWGGENLEWEIAGGVYSSRADQ